MQATSRTMPPTPVAAPSTGQHLARVVVALVARAPAARSSHGAGSATTPASSPGPSSTCGASVGRRAAGGASTCTSSARSTGCRTARPRPSAAGGRAARAAASTSSASRRRRAWRAAPKEPAGSAKSASSSVQAGRGHVTRSVTSPRSPRVRARTARRRCAGSARSVEARGEPLAEQRRRSRDRPSSALAERAAAVERRAARAPARGGRPRRAPRPAAASASSTRCE